MKVKKGENQEDRVRETEARIMKERRWGEKLENSGEKRGLELIVAEGKEEVECDGWVCDADSSMLVTLAGRGGRAAQNINVSSLLGRQERAATFYVFLTMFHKIW